MLKGKEPKIILWDIETSLIIATTFTLYPDRIPHDGILQDWSIICGAWKELGSKKVEAVAIKKTNDDYEVCKKLREALVDADIVVHHNGDKFDIKKLNARLIFHKLPPLPPIPTVDTLKEVKKVANFTSNRLDYLGKHLFGEGKIHTEQGLWMEVIRGNMSAIPKMVAYNKGDVLVLEKLYTHLRPYMKGHPRLNQESATACHKCGSTNVKKNGIRLTATGVQKQEYQCRGCGAYHLVALTKAI